MGFREIFDLATPGLSVSDPFGGQHAQIQRGKSRSHSQCAARDLRSDLHLPNAPEQALPVIAKYMRVAKDDPALIQAQETFAKHLNLSLTPSPEGIKFILDFLAEQRPALRGRNPADFIELKFLKKLEEDGFFKQFATQQ
jgi:hypothetical protein